MMHFPWFNCKFSIGRAFSYYFLWSDLLISSQWSHFKISTGINMCLLVAKKLWFKGAPKISFLTDRVWHKRSNNPDTGSDFEVLVKVPMQVILSWKFRSRCRFLLNSIGNLGAGAGANSEVPVHELVPARLYWQHRCLPLRVLTVPFAVCSRDKHLIWITTSKKRKLS